MRTDFEDEVSHPLGRCGDGLYSYGLPRHGLYLAMARFSAIADPLDLSYARHNTAHNDARYGTTRRGASRHNPHAHVVEVCLSQCTADRSTITADRSTTTADRSTILSARCASRNGPAPPYACRCAAARGRACQCGPGPPAWSSAFISALYRLYIGIADGMPIARVWTCRRRCRYRADIEPI